MNTFELLEILDRNYVPGNALKEASDIRDGLHVESYTDEQLRRMCREVTMYYVPKIKASKKEFRCTDETFSLSKRMSDIQNVINNELWERL